MGTVVVLIIVVVVIVIVLSVILLSSLSSFIITFCLSLEKHLDDLDTPQGMQAMAQTDRHIHRMTDIAAFRLNRPRGRLSENACISKEAIHLSYIEVG